MTIITRRKKKDLKNLTKEEKKIEILSEQLGVDLEKCIEKKKE